MRKSLLILAVMSLTSVMMFAQASSKATAGVNTAVWCTYLTAGSASDTGVLPVNSCTDLFTGAKVAPTADNFIPVMHATIKVSNSQSLFVTPSLVTGLYTNTAVKTKTSGGTGSSSTAMAMGGVYMRAVLKDPSGNIVATAYPIADCANFDTAPFGCVNVNGDWGVILDSRIQTLSQTLSGCTTFDGSGNPTGTCSFDLTTQLILQTASAHSFGLIFPNVGVGYYTVEVQAAVDSDATVTTSGGGSGYAVGASAFGLGSVTVESVRLVHDFSF